MKPARLSKFDYRGSRAYSLTFCTYQRRRYFEDPKTVHGVRLQILRTIGPPAFEVLAYCFMPDHLHMLVAGLTETAALLPAVKLSRQRSAVAFRESTGAQLWQPGYFERTLRDDEDVDVVARYIEANPVRAELVSSVGELPFTGGSLLSPN